MTFRLNLKTLAAVSRQLGTMLDAGLPIRRALAIIERGAHGSHKALFRRLGESIEGGSTFEEALEREGRAFPLLFRRLVRVGETVGGLDRVLKRLADYYDFVRSMWMRLITRLIYPTIQYWALILILAGVTYITSILANAPDAAARAMKVFLTGVLIFCAPILLYFFASRVLGASRFVHEILLRMPLVGNVMRTLAIARFSWSMELMTEAGVRIFEAIRWSMEASANPAFAARAERMIEMVRDGSALSEALEASRLFPYDYVQMLHVAEESGSMPDAFARLARYHFEKADNALRALATAFGWMIWVIVAGVIIYYIFKFAMTYISAISGIVG